MVAWVMARWRVLVAVAGTSHIKDLVFLAPMTPSNVKPLTSVPCGLFHSFYSAAIQFLKSRTTQPQAWY